MLHALCMDPPVVICMHVDSYKASVQQAGRAVEQACRLTCACNKAQQQAQGCMAVEQACMCSIYTNNLTQLSPCWQDPTNTHNAPVFI
mmetsp:Transcript_7759/g.20666  ORF Transcript_7759/g.20666 Transcript_7759/m.20666 type:complete len:88 (+) Transcript_7759:536-799(+)